MVYFKVRYLDLWRRFSLHLLLMLVLKSYIVLFFLAPCPVLLISFSLLPFHLLPSIISLSPPLPSLLCVLSVNSSTLPPPRRGPWSAVSAASGRGPGSRVPGPEAAAAAGDGAAQCLPEQDQDADRGAARARASEAGAEGVAAPGSPGAKGAKPKSPTR